MNKKFTPGPWVMEENAHNSRGVWIGKDEETWSALSCGATNEIAAANARLIAAAPEMFELLERIVNGNGDGVYTDAQYLLTKITTP